jgi:broad specificity phosphatase PhoE
MGTLLVVADQPFPSDLPALVKIVEQVTAQHFLPVSPVEPFEDVRVRAKKLRRFIFKQYRGSRVLVVSHTAFLQQFHGVLRGKNCIESLADFISTFKMTLFIFSGNRLIEERSVKLVGKEQFDC